MRPFKWWIRRVRAATNEILLRKSRRSQEENRVNPVQNYGILSVMSALARGYDVIMMPITRFSLANCKIGNVDEVCLRKLKKSEIFLEVGSVDVDRINHFYDFACEDYSGRTDVFGQQRSWTVVKCGMVCNVTECVFSRLKSHCTNTLYTSHCIVASGRES
ncbi:conserved hypothetical protein, partial [Trichinella spiralis]|uniref:hypothetical protein n=1 Tax=Trichinella spiralis TaxID=6334 RepID=UPI0001EFD64D